MARCKEANLEDVVIQINTVMNQLQKKKIAVVSSGNSVHVKKLMNAMADRGFELTLFTLPNHIKLKDTFDPRIKIHLLPYSGAKGYILNAPYLRRQLKEGQFDLVNSHYVSGYGTLTRMSHFHPSALAVFGSDVYEFPFKSPFHRRLIIKNLDSADVLTSTSHVMEKKVREFYKTDKKIYVTPFGVDLSVFHPVEVQKDYSLFTFGIVKKIAPKYGISTLLRAFASFKKNHPNDKVRLLIYGSGPYENDYKRLTDDLGLSGVVTWGGFVNNLKVPEVLSKMDVACFPSESESFGVAAVEAMACGVPVITSDASGFTEVNEDGVTGIIVKKKSIEELTTAMEKMYKMSSEERKQIGRNGIERVQRLYDFNDNIQTYISAISSVL